MRLRELPVIFRAREWWEFKLGPVLALIYGTALRSNVSLFDYWWLLAGIIVALAAVGAFANVLNDWTDLDDDRASGKHNRLAGRARALPLLLVLLTGLLGLSAAWLVRPGAAGLLLYGAIVAVFSLYSIAPVRLKRRGLGGILADAAGAHIFPALFAVVAFAHASGIALTFAWILTVGLWAFTSGIRGILWHQLRDYENDKRTGGKTFVCRHGPEAARKLGERVIFPLELAALCGLLVLCGSAVPFLVLGLDMLLTRLRVTHRDIEFIVVNPRQHSRVWLLEFNDTLLPVSLLLTSAFRHPVDFIVLLVHAAIFPVRLKTWLRDFGRLLVKAGKRSRKRSREARQHR